MFIVIYQKCNAPLAPFSIPNNSQLQFLLCSNTLYFIQINLYIYIYFLFAFLTLRIDFQHLKTIAFIEDWWLSIDNVHKTQLGNI